MTFQMIDADKRLSQADRETFCSAVADQKRGEKSRATGGGDAIDIGQRTSGALQGCLDERTDSGQMIPGSHFRNDPAILLVQIDLARNLGGQNLTAELEESLQPSRHTKSRSLIPTRGSLLSRLGLFVILIINHGSLQSIDSAIQLGILLVVDKFLLVRAEESVAMPQKQCALLIGGQATL